MKKSIYEIKINETVERCMKAENMKTVIIKGIGYIVFNKNSFNNKENLKRVFEKVLEEIN